MRSFVVSPWPAFVFFYLSLVPHSHAAPSEKIAKSKMRQLADTIGCDFEDRYYASQHLPEIHRYVHTWNKLRKTGILDFYNGHGHMRGVGIHRGHVADCFDVANDPSENICTKDGFYKGLDKVLEVILWGLIMWGPPCSLWLCFLSVSISKRTKENPAGDLTNKMVQIANLICENTTVLMVVAYERLTNQLLEQPQGSYYIRYNCCAWLLEQTGWGKTMITTWMKLFNHWAPKPSKLLGNLPSLKKLRRVYSEKRWAASKKKLSETINAWALKQRHFPKRSAMQWWRKRRPAKDKSTFYISSSGWTCGSKHLPGAGAYTWLFCKTTIELWEQDYKMQIKGKLTYQVKFVLQDAMIKMPFGPVHGPPISDAATPPKTKNLKKASRVQTNTMLRYVTGTSNSTRALNDALLYTNPALYALQCLSI
jgi:hypothetical protein